MLLKELVLSGGETFTSYSLVDIHDNFVEMTTAMYLENADKEIDTWFLQKDETAPDGARIVVKLKEE